MSGRLAQLTFGWLAWACVLTSCNSLEGGAVRRQQLMQDNIEDRSFLTVRWRRVLREHGIFTYLPEEFAGAASSHGGRRIYVGTRGGELFCLQSATGRLFWKIQVGAGVTSQPLVVERLGLLYVGADNGAMHAFHLATGARKWQYRTKGIIYQPPVYMDGVIYFANQRDQVFSLDARTGRWRWSYDRESPEGFTVAGHSRPLVWGGRLYAGFSDGKLVCLGARGGETRWTRSLAGNQKEYVDVDSTPVIVKNVLYASSFTGGLHALTAQGGALRWRFPVEGASTVTVSGDRIFFASASAGLHALDLEGRLRWRQRLTAGSPSAPIVRGRVLYLTFSKGGLYVVDRVTGRLIQKFNPGGGVSGTPLLTADSAFLLSNEGSFFAMTLR